MTKFRPCIDLHQGQVKQIVGSTLTDDGEAPTTNFVSLHAADFYAKLYKRDNLQGGHIIMLGEGNEEAARLALAAWHGGMQVGGGITPANAQGWIEAGASHVIVTSYLFSPQGQFLPHRLQEMLESVGAERLVVDLSCRRVRDGWQVAMNRWQTITDLPVSTTTLDALAGSCAEFLIHAADVEGMCHGIDAELVRYLGQWRGLPMTYAGGVMGLADLEAIDALSGGAIDATVGSALDLFGGDLLCYGDMVAWNRR